MTTLLPSIDEQLNGVIWRMEIDGLTDAVFLEIRNSKDKQVSFTSIDLLAGKINFTGITTPERWLTGIETACNGILLLHNYQSENVPVHKGVIAVNNKGAVIWNNYTYAFDHLTINGPILYNTQLQPKKLFLADIKTGTTLRPYEPLIDTELISPITIPGILSTSELSQTLPLEPYGNQIHSLLYTNFRIVSLHTLSAGQLKQHLYVFDESNLVYEDLLNADIQKMQPESFILYKHWLIYIKNQSELKVLSL